MAFTFYKQQDKMDCGPSCLRMIAKYYGKTFRQQTIADLCQINKEGVSLLGISEAAETIGFRTIGGNVELERLQEIQLPCILYWEKYHFVVLYKVKKGYYYLADPSIGLIKLEEQDFLNSWYVNQNQSDGIALLLYPTKKFYQHKDDKYSDGLRWSFLIRYLYNYRTLVLQLFVGLGIGTLLQLIAPFFTQTIVDVGIKAKNLNFIYLILIAQGVLIIGRVTVEFIRSWILLYVSTRINISILTDFLIKLMKLPMSFFDTKMTGDIMQRIDDQKRIENFLTGSTLTILFSFVNMIVFSFILAYYNFRIFIVLCLSSSLYTLWIASFLRRRRLLDYRRFDISAQNQSNMVQLVHGMQEIKLNNCEQQKRWEWEHLQAKLFKFNVKSLTLGQYQQGGSTFINETGNLIITFLSAKAVIDGELTLGAMIAMQYIIGQLNSPIQQFQTFMQSFQDAKISIERLNEIHQMQDEEPEGEDLFQYLPDNKNIVLKNITFKYPGPGNENVLKNVNLFIPEGKTTAIVGMSGSGKTTILKLLLRFYQPEEGEILIGNERLNSLGFRIWRSNSGVVMQEGFIFSDTIARNIAVGSDLPDETKLLYAVKMANIEDMISSLPLGLETKIGAEGNGISQGQRQRILIARAIYKDPHYIFFDEATNALDANNEAIIMANLKDFFRSRTVIIVAHRLSTVSHADNIVVLERGEVIEQGTHNQLTALRGNYYKLVKNQLELGN